jgi:hypothetical protein
MLHRPLPRPIVDAYGRPLRPGYPWDLAGGGRAREALDLFSGGAFTRPTEGSYLLGAPTDGSSAFLAWAAANERRIEDGMLLMEGSRTNYVLQARDQTSWTGGSAVSTSGFAGPDATVSAWRTQAASTQWGRYYPTIAGLPAGACVASQWQRMGSADTSWQVSGSTGSAVARGGTFASAAYQRNELPATAALSSGVNPIDGRDWTANGGVVASAHDVIGDLLQVEAGYFPTSAIRTVGAPVTRGADVLSYAVGQYPASFLTRGLRFTFAPIFSSAELVAGGAAHMVMQFAGASAESIRLSTDGVNAILYVFGGGALKITSSALTWSRNQALTFTINPAAGTATVSGATSGNGAHSGAAWAFASGQLNVGNSQAGTAPTFGRFGRYIEAL